MPRKRKIDQRRGAVRKNQWPGPSVWGSGPNADLAAERWFLARQRCDVEGCLTCARDRRLARQRGMYGRRRR